jgi:hypothetical protein
MQFFIQNIHYFGKIHFFSAFRKYGIRLFYYFINEIFPYTVVVYLLGMHEDLIMPLWYIIQSWRFFVWKKSIKII